MSNSYTVTMPHDTFNKYVAVFVTRLKEEVAAEVADIREMARNVKRKDGDLKPRWFESKRSKGRDLIDSVEVDIENARSHWTQGIYYEREKLTYPLLFEKIATMRDKARQLGYAVQLMDGSHSAKEGALVTIPAHGYNKAIFGAV